MEGAGALGDRRFGRVNWLGLWTLYLREVQRFLSVWSQTLAAPIATSVLFMVVFTLAFGEHRGDVLGVPFDVFLAPGVLMMSVIQNAFANTSSSVLVAKVQGNIVDTLMPPLSGGELLAGYALGGATRGLLCALGVALVIFPVVGVGLQYPLWAVYFACSAAVMLALMGLLGGIYANKFDQMAAITNFVVTPLSFLSGTFYSIERLPDAFAAASRANPFFYLIDGFRYGALGVSDASPWTGLVVTLALNAALGWLCWRWLARGYRLKA